MSTIATTSYPPRYHVRATLAAAFATALIVTILSSTSVLIELAIKPRSIINFPLYFIAIPSIAAVMALVGAIIGSLAGCFKNKLLAAATGIFLTFVLSAISNFYSPAPPAYSIADYCELFTGYTTVAAVAMIASTVRYADSSKLHLFRLYSIIAIMSLLIATVTCILKLSPLNSENLIRDAGGSITWSTLEYPEGRLVVSFDSSTLLTDKQLAHLIPYLRPIRKLELSLSHSQITDASAPLLITLLHLKRLDLDHTRLTPQTISDLRSKLPSVWVNDSWPPSGRPSSPVTHH